ncbi:hypothetical protein K2173_022342 [Erythroxylum novogranatense]|uniref:Potassium transporter n=1 Tax=Erythroxylum novogranatense TaxID=1862640 RepID=A0AAV8TJ83_9ROSI|nr:hypothetical protein K2173_022342 [Erythroxylum novogranatense]
MEDGNKIAEKENRSPKEHEIMEEIDYVGGKKLRKKDSFDMESTGEMDTCHRQVPGWGTILTLAFQCIGVVFGDLGTSPLYTLPGIFPDGIKHNDDLLGALSMIFYVIVLITLIKYILIVLAANDNGDGGTFALYSLICRHVKISMMPNQQAEDREVSNFKLEMPNRRTRLASAVKSKLESSKAWSYFLLMMTLTAVSMVIGDGILTPCISVLSAVGGIKLAASSLSQDAIMWISVVILIFLFQIQRFGTDKVGYAFAPILLIWFAFLACIGIYNFFRYDPDVIKALNPWYIVMYFKRNKKDGWISLGGVILCLTGSEALFADLGHFNIRSIQLSSCCVLLPSILLAYFGQCSYLRKHNDDILDSFYKSIPGPLYWPQFVLAVLASVIASQSLISASFSIVQQSLALGCFPRVKVVHTSEKYEGQVYVPEVNFLLMIACVGVTLGFKSTIEIGNAYGLAVAFVFCITSTFLILVMVMIWKTHPLLVLLYMITICAVELIILSSVFYKFIDGGYLPFAFALIMVIIMFIWQYGYRKKYQYELENKVSSEKLTNLASDLKIHRLPGLALFYTQLVHGVSPIFSHYVANVPALHSILLFVSVKTLPISRVSPEDRFLFQRVGASDLIFRCVVRYGYCDPERNKEGLEQILVDKLKQFIELHETDREEASRQLAKVDNALREGGVVYLMGEGEVVASSSSNFAKKFAIDSCYSWLSRCVRQQDEVMRIPRKRLVKVGMTYEV